MTLASHLTGCRANVRRRGGPQWYGLSRGIRNFWAEGTAAENGGRIYRLVVWVCCVQRAQAGALWTDRAGVQHRWDRCQHMDGCGTRAFACRQYTVAFDAEESGGRAARRGDEVAPWD